MKDKAYDKEAALARLRALREKTAGISEEEVLALLMDDETETRNTGRIFTSIHRGAVS